MENILSSLFNFFDFPVVDTGSVSSQTSLTSESDFKAFLDFFLTDNGSIKSQIFLQDIQEISTIKNTLINSPKNNQESVTFDYLNLLSKNNSDKLTPEQIKKAEELFLNRLFAFTRTQYAQGISLMEKETDQQIVSGTKKPYTLSMALKKSDLTDLLDGTKKETGFPVRLLRVNEEDKKPESLDTEAFLVFDKKQLDNLIKNVIKRDESNSNPITNNIHNQKEEAISENNDLNTISATIDSKSITYEKEDNILKVNFETERDDERISDSELEITIQDILDCFQGKKETFDFPVKITPVNKEIKNKAENPDSNSDSYLTIKTEDLIKFLSPVVKFENKEIKIIRSNEDNKSNSEYSSEQKLILDAYENNDYSFIDKSNIEILKNSIPELKNLITDESVKDIKISSDLLNVFETIDVIVEPENKDTMSSNGKTETMGMLIIAEFPDENKYYFIDTARVLEDDNEIYIPVNLLTLQNRETGFLKEEEVNNGLKKERSSPNIGEDFSNVAISKTGTDVKNLLSLENEEIFRIPVLLKTSGENNNSAVKYDSGSLFSRTVTEAQTLKNISEQTDKLNNFNISEVAEEVESLIELIGTEEIEFEIDENSGSKNESGIQFKIQMSDTVKQELRAEKVEIKKETIKNIIEFLKNSTVENTGQQISVKNAGNITLPILSEIVENYSDKNKVQLIPSFSQKDNYDLKTLNFDLVLDAGLLPETDLRADEIKIELPVKFTFAEDEENNVFDKREMYKILNREGLPEEVRDSSGKIKISKENSSKTLFNSDENIIHSSDKTEKQTDGKLVNLFSNQVNESIVSEKGKFTEIEREEFVKPDRENLMELNTENIIEKDSDFVLRKTPGIFNDDSKDIVAEGKNTVPAPEIKTNDNFKPVSFTLDISEFRSEDNQFTGKIIIKTILPAEENSKNEVRNPVDYTPVFSKETFQTGIQNDEIVIPLVNIDEAVSADVSNQVSQLNSSKILENLKIVAEKTNEAGDNIIRNEHYNAEDDINTPATEFSKKDSFDSVKGIELINKPASLKIDKDLSVDNDKDDTKIKIINKNNEGMVNKERKLDLILKDIKTGEKIEANIYIKSTNERESKITDDNEVLMQNFNNKKSQDLFVQNAMNNENSGKEFAQENFLFGKENTEKDRIKITGDKAEFTESLKNADNKAVQTGKDMMHRMKIVPETPEEVITNVVKYAKLALKAGSSEVTIKFEPEDLGKLHMKLVMKNSKLVGQIQVDSKEVKELLTNNMNQLRDSLQESGVDIQRFDVFTKEEHNQYFNDNRETMFENRRNRVRDNSGNQNIKQNISTGFSGAHLRSFGYNSIELTI